MSACNELKRLLDKAEVIPYRRVGKVRVAHNPKTPADTLAAAVAAVKKFAPSLVDAWGEPEGNKVSEWRDRGLTVAEVCDDPLPSGVDLDACPVSWLVERAARYHFRIVAAPPADIRFEGAGDWQVKKVIPLLPAWYVEACKARREEIVTAVVGPVSRDTNREPAGLPEPSPSDPEEESTPIPQATAPPIIVATIVATIQKCPKCSRPADTKGQCWKCHDRPCAKCGRMTGSAFLSLCDPCGLLEPN